MKQRNPKWGTRKRIAHGSVTGSCNYEHGIFPSSIPFFEVFNHSSFSLLVLFASLNIYWKKKTFGDDCTQELFAGCLSTHANPKLLTPSPTIDYLVGYKMNWMRCGAVVIRCIDQRRQQQPTSNKRQMQFGYDKSAFRPQTTYKIESKGTHTQTIRNRWKRTEWTNEWMKPTKQQPIFR